MDATARRLNPPPAADAGVAAAVTWVKTHLLDVVGSEPVNASTRFRGGDEAATYALTHTDLSGYASTRGNVQPSDMRGATALSPYIRHGMLTLPLLWRFAQNAPFDDQQKFRDELLWQEYARHLYARLGRTTKNPLRFAHASATAQSPDVTGDATQQMACLDTARTELAADGFLVNQQRLWVASHFSVHQGLPTADGEDLLYRQLLDGSRAANRLGWQWTSGQATGRPYLFTRNQVERYAPQLCNNCPRQHDCPIAKAPGEPVLIQQEPNPKLRRDDDAAATAGPAHITQTNPALTPQAVWLTAESLSRNDPALLHHPSLPAVFVFDVPLLKRLKLAPKRLVFLAETLGDLATQRDVHVWRGDVADVLSVARGTDDASRAVATTFAPVPGWALRAQTVVELHPWPWLRRPHTGPVTSFTAWRRHAEQHQ